MAQSAFTIRLDSDLKLSFEKLCSEFGMSSNTAFNIFVRAVIRNRSIPFAIESTPRETSLESGKKAFLQMREIIAQNGVSMSLQEINKEIGETRKSMHK
ncbi:MAG: type II toxin-antitoxin system RelB/DinJ family antitoxin [Muribaculaceae bacterium]|nr:type II toxin-antitoxin system RelB/DinJ family antitoxin [Muribaculaceae bacterium]